MTLNEITGWVVTHGLALLIGGLVLVGLYRFAASLIPRLVSGVIHVQQTALSGGPPTEELDKRTSTLQDVLAKLVRAGFLIALILLVLNVFDLGGALAGLGLVAAALTLAGQAIVLDYLMGIIILVEGPYFKGDWIAINGAGVNVEGQVEEITLRRTTLRDNLGQLHSVSNGLIRVSSNTTRIFSVATVEVQVLRPADLDRAIAVAGAAARDFATQRAWNQGADDSGTSTSVTGLTLDGATLRVQVRVPPGQGGPATSELRRRLAAAFGKESIGTGRWDTPPLAAAPVAVPTDDDTEPETQDGAGPETETRA